MPAFDGPLTGWWAFSEFSGEPRLYKLGVRVDDLHYLAEIYRPDQEMTREIVRLDDMIEYFLFFPQRPNRYPIEE